MHLTVLTFTDDPSSNSGLQCVDDGPVLASVEVPINLDDTFESLQARIHAAEHRLLVQTIKSLVTPSPTDNDEQPDDTKATSP